MKISKGFTLIELLVVISIIGLLSSVVLASLNTARAKARDTRRISDLTAMRTALAFYYDKNGSYPATQNLCCSWPTNHNTNFEEVALALKTAGFLSSIPKDPSSINNGYYLINDAGNPATAGYIITTLLETVAPTTQAPFGSCRPYDQNWCSSTVPSNYYCLCNPY